ncbi:MAG: hypothetical protein DHS20C15_29280 [Planctomycetota bacterium]|nr:MAG: hypothetical protein DHS20C15_29280 [Planctomycetota bacterium]
MRAFADFLRRHPQAGSEAFELYRADRPALEPDLSSLFTLYRQAQGLFHSMVSDSTMADLGRMLESVPEALPEHEDESDGPPPESPADSLNSTLDALDALCSPRDRWVFEQRIGEGGMGVVDRVWDRNLGREGARKTVMLPIGRDPKARLALFLEEIRVISKLEHPSIVPIYEAGLDAKRRLFFVMKLVRGRDLRSVLDELHGEAPADPAERWTLNRVLGHLVSVSQALAYAHSKGVLHRDVKPANIMVGRYGESYLLDWGLARLIDTGDASPETTHEAASAASRDAASDDAANAAARDAASDAIRDATNTDTDTDTDTDTPADSATVATHRWAGTPSYIAPERVSGPEQPEDPREDVYSLGAVLYHALTGFPPFLDQLKRGNLSDLRALVVDGTPTPLEKLVPEAPDDLVALCEASMARDRVHRPASSEEFARALQKYLADVSEDRIEARRQAARAQRTFDFLLDMLRQADPYVAQGRDTTVLEVLERASQEAGERLEDEPEDAASMLTILAEMLLTMGRPHVAGPLLEQAEEILEQVGDRGLKARLDTRYQRARCARKLGHIQESERLYRDLLRDATEHFGADAEIALRALYGVVSLVRRDHARFAEAVRLSTELLDRRRRVNGPEHAESLAAAVQLAGMRRKSGDIADGERVLAQNVDVLLARFGDMHLHTLLGMAELAGYLEEAGSLERARELYRDCARRFEQVVGVHSIGHCVTLANGAWLDHRLGRSDEAERELTRALAHMHASGEVDRLAVLAAEQNLGLVQLAQNKHEQACEQLEKVVLAAETGPPNLKAALGRFRSNWARALLSDGRAGEAREQLERSLNELRGAVAPDHEWIRDAEAWLEQASASTDRPD